MNERTLLVKIERTVKRRREKVALRCPFYNATIAKCQLKAYLFGDDADLNCRWVDFTSDPHQYQIPADCPLHKGVFSVGIEPELSEI
jgi:hypothetical protein